MFEKYESQLGWLFPIDRKIINVPNHQPDIYIYSYTIHYKPSFLEMFSNVAIVSWPHRTYAFGDLFPPCFWLPNQPGYAAERASTLGFSARWVGNWKAYFVQQMRFNYKSDSTRNIGMQFVTTHVSKIGFIREKNRCVRKCRIQMYTPKWRSVWGKTMIVQWVQGYTRVL